MLRSSTWPSSRWLAALAATSVLACSGPLAAAPPELDEPAATPIALDHDPAIDRAIEQRLAAIYAELDALAGVEVEVAAGVVHLRGRVLSLGAADEAEAIAGRIEGVAAITNAIEQEVGVGRRLQPIIDGFLTRAGAWLTYVPLVLIAASVVVSAWLFARLLARRSRQSTAERTFVRELLGQLFRFGIVALALALALEALGATALLGALLGTAGVIGIALGLALKDTGENYIASILLSIRQPFAPHDYVKIGDSEGAVVRLTSRATVLLSLAGNHIRIPNSTVFRATITNYTRNPERRFEFMLGVGFESELRKVQELAIATIAAIPGVLVKPAPSCFVEEFGASAMTISVGGWIDQRNADWFKVNSEARRLIKAAFDRAGIDVPEPIVRVRTIHDDPVELASEPAQPLDVSPDDHIVRQIDRQRAGLGEQDLLREDGRPE
ncbi:mechanosensitive ion channel family protein [Nannocystaceae bacterium ST9]